MRYTLNNVSIDFRNFSGTGSRYNAEGRRNFHVFFNDFNEAQRFSELGFNVKFPEGQTPHMKVNVNLESRFPPKIVLIRVIENDGFEEQVGTPEVLTSPNEIAMLDHIYISKADVVINDYHTDQYVSAYLQALYVTNPVDEFYLKYGV